MTDGVNITRGDIAATSRPAGYQAEAVREVRARAAVLEQEQSEEERRGLRRLNQLLSREQTPQQEVPRGFYLNIRV